MTTFTGTSGPDTFDGTSSADVFNLQQGGNDTANGEGGNDTFNMGAALNAADRIDGGGGTDTVSLDGGYSAGLTFTSTTMVNVEAITLAAGHNYDLTVNEATVAAGKTLTVDGSALGASDQLTFDALPDRDASFVMIGGAGNDVLSGNDYEPDLGAALTDTFDLTHGGNDTVHVGYNVANILDFGASFTAADSVSGGNSGLNGRVTIVLDGDYTGTHAVDFGPTTVVNVDTIQVDAGHSYVLSSNNANLGHGQHTLIDASALGSGNSISFDGSAQTAGVFDFTGGAGNDVFIGSSGGENNLGGTFDLSKGGNDTVTGSPYSDTFKMGAALTAADRLTGNGQGAYGDKLELDGNYTGLRAVVFTATTAVGFTKFVLDAGHSYDLTSNNATVAATGLLVDASALAAANSLTFNGSAETNGGFYFIGGAGNDNLIGGSRADYFQMNKGGADIVNAGAGNDQISMGGRLTAADTINGGAGFDWVELNGNYSAGLTLSATTLRNVETLQLDGGHSYSLTTADATVASGKTLAVDSSALASGQTLNFNGAAETNGNFTFAPGAETDTIRGGAGNDSIDFGTHFTAQDFFNGGAGTDSVTIGASPGALTLSNLKNIENLDLGGGSYNLTTTDSLVASGAQLFVEFDGATASQTLTFDGSAETNGSFGIEGGSGNDHLVGGAKSDGLGGGGGADFLRGGPGHDNYFYDQVSDSTSSTYDTIFGFNANQDTLVLQDGDTVTGLNSKITHGALWQTTFDSDLTTAVSSAHLGAHHAVLFTPDSGSLAGDTFLVIDANGHSGYQAGQDYVIRLASASNLSSLTAFNFNT